MVAPEKNLYFLTNSATLIKFFGVSSVVVSSCSLPKFRTCSATAIRRFTNSVSHQYRASSLFLTSLRHFLIFDRDMFHPFLIFDRPASERAIATACFLL